MNSGNSWTNVKEENWTVGWDWEEAKINYFACQGNSEEIKEIKQKIQKYQSGKDYYYSPNEEIESWGKCEKYTIYNQKLKKELWELYSEWFGDKCHLEHLEHLEPVEHFFDHSWPDKPLKPLKPIKPLRPLRPVGKPKENEEWKKYIKEVDKYQKEMKKFHKETEDYNEKMREYNQEIEKHNKKKVDKNLADAHLTEDNFSASEHEIKNKWKWKEFWIGCSFTLIILVATFALFRLFKKKG
jgi:hypothetical protein